VVLPISVHRRRVRVDAVEGLDSLESPPPFIAGAKLDRGQIASLAVFKLMTGLQMRDQLVLAMKPIAEDAARAEFHVAVEGRKLRMGLGVARQVTFVFERFPTAGVITHVGRLA
jgi:hypothetical protein